MKHLEWPESGWGYMPANEETFGNLQDVLDIAQPKAILEIGFYAGHSTSYWAELTDPTVEIVSCCPDHHSGRKRGPIVENAYPNVTVHLVPSPFVLTHLNGAIFDLTFIDGNHTYNNCYQDTLIALTVQSRYVLYDNVETAQVRQVIDEFIEMGYMEEVKQYTYFSNFKNDAKTLEQVLCKIL